MIERMRDYALGLADAARDRKRLKQTPIVPQRNVAGTALACVIAIMTFLSCLTFGGVTLVSNSASEWQTQIAREATIQIKPSRGLDIDKAITDASAIASSFTGVLSTRVVDEQAMGRLLEPWLGSGLDLDELPVPRLVVLSIDHQSPPDFAAIRERLSREVPAASIDDHRTWVDRLVAMARSTVLIGLTVLMLMLSATTLAVVFATRGAMAGNGHIIEVLHFVGAQGRFIAAQFGRHFLATGFKGATAGGAAAMLVFGLFSWWSSRNMATPEADQAAALFGNFSIGTTGYLGAFVIILVIAILAAATSHLTVLSYLRQIEDPNRDFDL
ncbi:cell division protein FtsX [Limoniibacter endophyticus]|uniref:Cell division protein FtsX n=1 Tax=Limoniibacter endophyticus TaxID=1565040 RepID=A0A8J3GH31_9HYPH|nr:ABC transporter permease [Limoniibacter endophyticus]GHC76302.1 cell division protein FtsX [Limoniibacter endophyticus]